MVLVIPWWLISCVNLAGLWDAQIFGQTLFWELYCVVSEWVILCYCTQITLCLFGTVAHQAFLSFTISQSAQTYVHWVGDAIQPSHPLSSCSPPAFNLSQRQGLFQWVTSGGQSIGASFNFSPSNEYSGLISFRIDWFDLLALQGTLKSILQHHSSKASVLLQCSTFLMVQL